MVTLSVVRTYHPGTYWRGQSIFPAFRSWEMCLTENWYVSKKANFKKKNQNLSSLLYLLQLFIIGLLLVPLTREAK